jgi:Flp pilus assembly protein TadG
MATASSHAFRRHRTRSPGVLRRFLGRARADRSGTAAVEFGLVVPVLALMVVAVSDIGLGIARKMQVENAVQLGTAYAVVRGFDASAISTIVTGTTSDASISASPPPALACGCATGSSISAAACGSTCPGGAMAGTYVSVSAQATYNTTLNYGVVPSTYTLTAQSTVRLQ